MFSRLKKEWQQIKTAKEHMQYVPTSSEDPADNFEEIKMLIQRYNSHHSIKGEAQFFTIGQQPYYHVLSVLAGLFILLFVGYGIFVICYNYDEVWAWLWGSLFIGFGILFARMKLPQGTYIGMEVDTIARTVTIFDDNLFRRHFTGIEVIHFDDVHGIHSEDYRHKIRKTFAQMDWRKIYLDHANGSSLVISLPYGGLWPVNHEAFMTCLMRIIKARK